MKSVGLSNFIIAIPEIYLVLIAFIILLFGLTQNVKEYVEKIVFFYKISYITMFSIFLSIILIISIGDVYVASFNGIFMISPTIYVYKIILLLLVLMITILSRRYLIDIEMFHYEYLVVFLFFVVGNLLMVSSNDFLAFYTTLELTTICLYILMFMDKYSTFSMEAGIKYFLLGALGTAFLLYGISLLYGYTGNTSFTEIKAFLQNKPDNWIAIIALVMIIVGIGFKLSLVPFHMWTPDVYRGVNNFVLLLLAVIVKISVLFIFVRILWEPLLYMKDQWQYIIELLIILSAIIGFIVAIYQTSLKSFIAYSSIGNMSYILLAVLNPSVFSMKSITFYLVSYAVALIGFVASCMLVKKDNKFIEEIYDLKGLYKFHPYLAFMITIFLLSLAGMPITAGFFAKGFILFAAIKLHLFTLAVVVAVLSVVIMYYYFRIIRIMYFTYEEEGDDLQLSYAQTKIDLSLVLLILFTFVIGFIFFLYPLNLLLGNFLVLL